MKNSKEQSDDVDNVGKGNDSNRKPLAKGAVIGDVVEKPIGEEKKEDSAPQLKEEDEVVDDGDKKPAARVKDAPKKKEPEVIVVPAVTLEGATYSKERMVEALVSTLLACIVYSLLDLLRRRPLTIMPQCLFHLFPLDSEKAPAASGTRT